MRSVIFHLFSFLDYVGGRGKEEMGRGWEGYHKDKKIDSLGGGEMEGLLSVRDDIVETEIDAPESEEETCHDEEVGRIGEDGPVEGWFAFSGLLAWSFADDEVGGDECEEDDEGDDYS